MQFLDAHLCILVAPARLGVLAGIVIKLEPGIHVAAFLGRNLEQRGLRLDRIEIIDGIGARLDVGAGLPMADRGRVA